MSNSMTLVHPRPPQEHGRRDALTFGRRASLESPSNVQDSTSNGKAQHRIEQNKNDNIVNNELKKR